MRPGWIRRAWRALEGGWWALRWGVEWWLVPGAAHETPRMRFETDWELACGRVADAVRGIWMAVQLHLQPVVEWANNEYVQNGRPT